MLRPGRPRFPGALCALCTHTGTTCDFQESKKYGFARSKSISKSHYTTSLWRTRSILNEKLGGEEPDEVQPGQGQGPAPGEEQPQAPGQDGAELLESSSAERDWECWGTTG